ncbi:uncharacterized protein LOC143074182 [Mytilus galloprovincialis]|uniref:uncharacterized protein LOC143074182 n=1 Tax=Mytilus galloprovincialis TaxID=29158 RepID=UPI003F7C6B2F
MFYMFPINFGKIQTTHLDERRAVCAEFVDCIFKCTLMNEMDTSIFPLFSVLLIMKIAAITCDKNTLYHSSTEVPHNWTGLDSSHLSITRDQPATSTTVSLHILSKRLLTDLTQSTILVTSNSSNTEINSTDKPVPALLMSTGKTRSSLNDLTMMSDSALLNARIIEASHVLATSSSSVKVKAFVAVTASVLETYTLTKNSSINTASLKTAYSSVNARSNITATSSVNGISNIAATVYVNATPFLTPTPSVHSTSSQVTAYSANTTSSITTTVSANETSSIAATFPTNETSSIASLPANARSSITTTFPENATASITATSPVLATSSITAASSVNVISSITTSFPANATSSITPTSSAKHASSIAATATLYAPFSITSIVSILTTTPSSATVTTFIKITTSTSLVNTSV